MFIHPLIQGFDMAKGTDIKTVYKTGWGVVGLAAIIALVICLWPRAEEPAPKYKKK